MKRANWSIVWYPGEKNPPRVLVRNATSAGNAFRRLYTVHRRLVDSGNVNVIEVSNRE